MTYVFHIIILFGIYLVLALSLNIVVGFAGLISLAHAAYFAIGAYTYAIGTIAFGLSFIESMFLGIIISCLFSICLSVPSFRFNGDFFVLASLVVQVLFFRLIYNWHSHGEEIGTWANLGNGPHGISGIPPPNILGFEFGGIPQIMILVLAISSVCLLVSSLVLKSPWGRLVKAMRDDELVTASLGKNTRRAKLQVFVFSCALAAVGGGLYASYFGYIDPSIASLEESILLLSFVLVGGVGNLRGPIVGAAVLIAIPEVLRYAAFPDAVAANVRLMLYGLLLVGMMHFRPQGLAGIYRPE